METKEKLEFNYFTLYLKKYLRDEGDPRADDVAFLNERGERAGIEAERCRKEGMTVDQSIEVGIHVLMSGLDDQKEDNDDI